MKRILLFLVAAVVAVILSLAGVFFAYAIAHWDEPAVVARNLTQMTIPQVSIDTDRGQSHVFTNLASQQSRRAKLSGRKKRVWIVATLADGRELSSEKRYMGSEGVLVASISDKRIYLDFER